MRPEDVSVGALAVAGSTDRYAARRFSVTRTPDEPITATVAELREAYNSGRSQPYAWRAKQLSQFWKMLVECQGEFEAALMADLHKSKFDSFLTEFSLVRAEIKYFQKHLKRLMKPESRGTTWLTFPGKGFVLRESLGLVLVFGAWNYPVQLSLLPMVGALAAGNCVLLKAPSFTDKVSAALAKCVPLYLDPACVRVLEGPREVSEALLKCRWDKIFYTGSTYVGRIVARAAAETLTPVVLELGGKSPCIVDKSADLTLAAKRIAFSGFNNSGQLCVRVDHVLVHEQVAPRFMAELKKQIVAMYSAEPQKSEFFGRIVNRGAWERLARLVADNRARVVHGGESDAADLYVAPTVFDFGPDYEAFTNSTLQADELFGPLLPCATFSSLDHAIKHCNSLPTGKPLGLYGFGTDAAFVDALLRKTTSGGVNINDASMHVINGKLPFGGVGNSGMGAYHERYSWDCFTHEKAVLQKTSWVESLGSCLLDSRFPPYTSFRKRNVKLLSA